jgi:flagellar biosynthesis/type III secretory pathway protein FliH
MKVKMIKVQSSNIEFIGRSKEGVVVVQFKGDTKYRYDKIPETIYNDFMASESKGKFMHHTIKSLDPGKKIKFLIDEKLELIYSKKRMVKKMENNKDYKKGFNDGYEKGKTETRNEYNEKLSQLNKKIDKNNGLGENKKGRIRHG